MDVDEIDLDSSEAESLEGMASAPIGASEAPAAAARRQWLPHPGFPRVTNLDEQARLFASDEETILIARLSALEKKEPVGPPHPPAPTPAPASSMAGSASLAVVPPARPLSAAIPPLSCNGPGLRGPRPLAERGAQRPDARCDHPSGEPVCLTFDNWTDVARDELLRVGLAESLGREHDPFPEWAAGGIILATHIPESHGWALWALRRRAPWNVIAREGDVRVVLAALKDLGNPFRPWLRDEGGMVMPWISGAPFDPLDDHRWDAEPGLPGFFGRPEFDDIHGHSIPEPGTVLTLAAVSEEVHEMGLGFVFFDKDALRWSRFCATAPVPNVPDTWAPYALRSCGFLHGCLDLERIVITAKHIEKLANEIGVVRVLKDARLDPVVPLEWGVGMTTYGIFDPQARRVPRDIQDRVRDQAAGLPLPCYSEVWVRDNRSETKAGPDGLPTDSVPLRLVSRLVAKYLRAEDLRYVQCSAGEGDRGPGLDGLFPPTTRA